MRAWLFSALTLLSACAPDSVESTAIAISVKTDLSGEELREVVYRVFAKDTDLSVGAPDLEERPALYEVTAPAEQLGQPLLILRGEDDAFLLSVEGYAERGASVPVVSFHALARFVPNRTMALHVFLSRACYQRDCGFPGLTCYGQTLGTVRGGTCGAIPTPRLDRVTRPGQESDWEPIPPTPEIDAGAHVVDAPTWQVPPWWGSDASVGAPLPARWSLGLDGGVHLRD